MTILGYDIDGQPLRAGDSAIIVTNMEVYGQSPADEGMIVTVKRIEPDKRSWHPLDCPCIEILEPTGILGCIGAQSLRKLPPKQADNETTTWESIEQLTGWVPEGVRV